MSTITKEQLGILIIDYLRLKDKEIKQKKKKSMRNKNYYQKNKDIIKQKNKIKNQLYNNYIKKF